MNAAARLVHQHAISRHLLSSYLFSRQQLAIFILALMTLMSAMAVVYVTHTTRVLHAAHQHNIVERERLHIERGQLLLERGAWIMQSRIQQIAEKHLGMIVPNQKSVVVIRE